jgi:23S rRNA (cytidine2498-2'-O)-methyltransferase
MQIIVTTRPESTAFAISELQNYDNTIRPVRDLAPGVKLISLPNGYEKLITDAPMLMFVRHIFPVQYFCEAGDMDIEALLAEVILKKVILPDDKTGAFSVQVYGNIPLHCIQTWEEALTNQGYIKNDKAPAWVLSVYTHESGVYAGASQVIHNRSAWSGGAVRYKKEGQICRAECKLMEAIEVFRIRFSPHAHALDLGAAPGGWSRILLDMGCRVTAVDPGALDSRLSHEKLLYVCATAQRFFAAQAQGTQFDIIVNDMKMDMYDSVRVMLDAACLLSPDGFALMTLKLAKGQGLSKINKALELLAKKYRVRGTRQLFHNRDEVTVLLSPAL